MNLDKIHELISYDPVSGVAINRRTGKVNQRTVMIDGKKEYLNRLLYELHFGPVGTHTVAFKDGDKCNFKATNLYLDTRKPAIVTRKASEYKDVAGIAHKTCTQCGEWKPLTDFLVRTDTGMPKSSCSPCDTARKKVYYSIPSIKRERRDGEFKLRYGISHDDYDALLIKQNNGCAICGTTDPSGKSGRFSYFSIDHSHATGKVRGLLCNHCNRGIGFLQDSEQLLLKAAKYLRDSNE